MNAIWQKLGEEWLIFLCTFLKALVILPLSLAVLSLYIANISGQNYTVSLILQILAAMLTAIATTVFYDRIKKVLMEDFISKKGLAAVRNLTLTRLKTKNIISRSENNAHCDEVKNLLSLLEKDIYNAIPDWEDVCPGASKAAENYNKISEMENELEKAIKEKKILHRQMAAKEMLNEQKKASLEEKLFKKEKIISELSNEMTRLRTEKTGALTLDQIGSPTLSSLNLLETLGHISTLQMCTSCGKNYTPTFLDGGICSECHGIKWTGKLTDSGS